MRLFLILVLLIVAYSGSAVAADATPALSYFPVLPFDAPNDAEPQWVPLAANHLLDGVHKGIMRAVIIIPDETRDATGSLAVISGLAGPAGQGLMILSPQFLLPSDLVRFADRLPDKGSAFATWNLSAWPVGDDSIASTGHKSISSFTVVDLLLMYLADRKSFPDLNGVAVIGSGIGANFVQRYASFNAAAAILSQQNIDLRYVVAGASSYLYLTAQRPTSGRRGFARPDPALCPGVNDYPYGLEKLNPYGRHVGANSAKIDYVSRIITYLNAPSSDNVPDTNCAALQQGKDGNARAGWYRAYLQTLYGDDADRTQTFALVKNAKNDAVSLFGSACGMAVLFGDGLCKNSYGEVP